MRRAGAVLAIEPRRGVDSTEPAGELEGVDARRIVHSNGRALRWVVDVKDPNLTASFRVSHTATGPVFSAWIGVTKVCLQIVERGDLRHDEIRTAFNVCGLSGVDPTPYSLNAGQRQQDEADLAMQGRLGRLAAVASAEGWRGWRCTFEI
jgi:hypothetical protein